MTILYNNNVYDYIKLYNDYILEYLKESDQDATPNNKEDAAIDLIQYDYESLIENIKNFDKNNDCKIYVSASLGLWYGRVAGYRVFNNLYDAVTSVLQDNNIIYYDNEKNTLKASCGHHDGINDFKFYMIKNNKKYAIKYNKLYED